jgi:hypothetical protein
MRSAWLSGPLPDAFVADPELAQQHGFSEMPRVVCLGDRY